MEVSQHFNELKNVNVSCSSVGRHNFFVTGLEKEKYGDMLYLSYFACSALRDS